MQATLFEVVLLQADLQELSVRIELRLEQIRNIENCRQSTEVFPNPLFLSEGISHLWSSPFTQAS